MVISLPLPLKSDAVPPKHNPEGLLTFSVPGFGEWVKVPSAEAEKVKTRIAGSLAVIAAEILFTSETDGPYNGLWLREYDYRILKKELGLA